MPELDSLSPLNVRGDQGGIFEMFCSWENVRDLEMLEDPPVAPLGKGGIMCWMSAKRLLGEY